MARPFGMSSGVQFGPGPLSRAVKQLLIANAGIFLLTRLVPFPWTTTFGLVPRAVVGELHVWQVFTYTFLHGGFWHLFMNMFALWMFGVTVEREWGYKAFLKFYLTMGTVAGVATWLFLMGSGVPTIGASGAVMGVLVAFAMLYPDAPILVAFVFPVPARIFVLLYAAMEFMAARSYASDGIGHVTHLAGMAAAYLYIKTDWRPAAVAGRWRRRLRAPRLRVVHPDQSAPTRPRPAAEAEVDAILDKISREGIDSLTEAEVKKLRERSRH